MDINQLIDTIHKNWAPFMIGAMATRPILCADIVFKAIMATPFKPLLLMNAPTILRWADSFEAEIAKSVETENKASIPK